jgi:hypothetical protein
VIGAVLTKRSSFEPTRFYVNQYVQLKYGWACERSGVLTAEKPIPPIERGSAEPELAAYVAVSEAKETNLAVGLEALARVKLLCEVENDAKELSSTDRWALRQERAVPLLGSMKRWLDEQYAAVLPHSAMGGAIGYALGNWQALQRYTEDGDISIDNNLVEQMLKLVAIGRKNRLFAASERGGRALHADFQRQAARLEHLGLSSRCVLASGRLEARRTGRAFTRPLA